MNNTIHRSSDEIASGGGIASLIGSPLLLQSSIVANNFVGAHRNDLSGNFDAESSHNLVRHVGDVVGISAGHENLLGVNPRLRPLRDNGGPTKTHALQPASPAIDAGSNPRALNTDQRGEGFPRTRGEATDIGAFEFKPSAKVAMVVGADSRSLGPLVRGFDAKGNMRFEFFAYDPSFTGGVRVAMGDVTGDGRADIIVGSGPGAPAHVKVFDGKTLAVVASFFAFSSGFTGGVYVAAGDVNGDGRMDIITGADSGAPGGHVKVFDGKTLAEIHSFLAFDGFTGGVRVAAGDINGDGKADIIAGAGPGAGPHVKVFSGDNLAVLASFFAFSPGFSGGVYVAAGDVNGDKRADIVTGAGSGAPGGHVKVFDGQTLAEIRSLLAFDTGFTGGVRVAAGDVNGDGKADIIAGAGPGGLPHVRAFHGTTVAELRDFIALPPNFTGGVFVAGGR